MIVGIYSITKCMLIKFADYIAFITKFVMSISELAQKGEREYRCPISGCVSSSPLLVVI